MLFHQSLYLPPSLSLPSFWFIYHLSFHIYYHFCWETSLALDRFVSNLSFHCFLHCPCKIGAFLVAQLVKNLLQCRRPRFETPGSGRSTGEGKGYPLQYSWASVVAQLIKNLLVLQETWVWSLGWEDPLEKGTATHSSILAWSILVAKSWETRWETFTFM